MNAGPLEEHSVFLMAEPSFQPFLDVSKTTLSWLFQVLSKLARFRMNSLLGFFFLTLDYKLQIHLLLSTTRLVAIIKLRKLYVILVCLEVTLLQTIYNDTLSLARWYLFSTIQPAIWSQAHSVIVYNSFHTVGFILLIFYKRFFHLCLWCLAIIAFPEVPVWYCGNVRIIDELWYFMFLSEMFSGTTRGVQLRMVRSNFESYWLLAHCQ